MVETIASNGEAAGRIFAAAPHGWLEFLEQSLVIKVRARIRTKGIRGVPEDAPDLKARSQPYGSGKVNR